MTWKYRTLLEVDSMVVGYLVDSGFFGSTCVHSYKKTDANFL